MNYNNGFPIGYSYYQQAPMVQQAPIMQQPTMSMQQTQVSSLQSPTSDNGIIWVQGEAGARGYLVAPGKSVIAIDGEPIPTSSAIETPGVVDQYNNVFSAIYVTIPAGCCYTIAIENTSDQAILVQNSNLIVERTA